MERCRMPVFRKKANLLKHFQHHQYRKKTWMSWYGKAFWQTTAVLCGTIAIIILYILNGLAGHWSETTYQVWSGLSQPFPQITFFNWNFWEVWLKAVYQKNICYPYLLQLRICILSIACILVIGYLLYNLFSLLYFYYLISEGGGLGID